MTVIEDQVGRRLECTVPAAQVVRLRAQLVEVGFGNLRAHYSDPRILDGTQIIVTVRVGEKQKTVYCDNSFPRAIRRLEDYLQDEFIQPRLAELRESGNLVDLEQTYPEPWPELRQESP